LATNSRKLSLLSSSLAASTLFSESIANPISDSPGGL
jgi:hypothetical protein